MDLINYNITNIGKNGDYNTSFIINKCQNKINNEINSKNQWLYFMEIIQNIKGKEIITLKGIIDKKKQVVLKIQNFELGKKEFDIQKKISNCSGFIKFYCHFNCNINPKFYNGSYIKGNKIENKLCNSKGNKMWINIMQYYSNGSLEDKLSTLNYDELFTIVKNVINNYFKAYVQDNFIHGDFEPKNIILNDNNEPLIIDFENSNFTGNIMSFWRDLDRFFYIIQRCINFDLNNFIRDNITMHMAYNRKPTEEIIILLLNNFQNIIIE
jgi:serine/threonine protein kinase